MRRGEGSTYDKGEREDVGVRVHLSRCMSFRTAPHPVAKRLAGDCLVGRHVHGVLKIGQLDLLNYGALTPRFAVDHDVVWFDIYRRVSAIGGNQSLSRLVPVCTISFSCKAVSPRSESRRIRLMSDIGRCSCTKPRRLSVKYSWTKSEVSGTTSWSERTYSQSLRSL